MKYSVGQGGTCAWSLRAAPGSSLGSLGNPDTRAWLRTANVSSNAANVRNASIMSTGSGIVLVHWSTHGLDQPGTHLGQRVVETVVGTEEPPYPQGHNHFAVVSSLVRFRVRPILIDRPYSPERSKTLFNSQKGG